MKPVLPADPINTQDWLNTMRRRGQTHLWRNERWPRWMRDGTLEAIGLDSYTVALLSLRRLNWQRGLRIAAASATAPPPV